MIQYRYCNLGPHKQTGYVQARGNSYREQVGSLMLRSKKSCCELRGDNFEVTHIKEVRGTKSNLSQAVGNYNNGQSLRARLPDG